MKRLLFLFLFILSFCTNAQEESQFDHKNIIVIAAIKDDKNCVFAGTEFFLQMRKIIENSMSQFSPIADMPTAYLYELFMMDKKGITKTVFLGDRWLSDGNLFAQLSEENFSLLSRVIKSRRFENDNAFLKSFTLTENIEGFNYLLLKPLEYQQIGRQPLEQPLGSATSPAAKSNIKITAEENKEAEGKVQNDDSHNSLSSSAPQLKAEEISGFKIEPKVISSEPDIETKHNRTAPEKTANLPTDNITLKAIVVLALIALIILFVRLRRS